MMAVIFELEPAPGKFDAYMDFATWLKPELEKIGGFISVERFESLTTPGKYVSISFWEDEEALARWRNHSGHRVAQAAGRDGIFAGYRLRVAAVVRDYGLEARDEAPPDSLAVL